MTPETPTAAISEGSITVKVTVKLLDSSARPVVGHRVTLGATGGDALHVSYDGAARLTNLALLDAGHQWAEANLDFKYRIPATRATEPQIVVNGNTALALGVMASGMDVCAMYPITPATSASHYLSEVFENVGGIVHQAEDEIAAITSAIGACVIQVLVPLRR